ncbi:MAG: potassium transporter Kup [Acidimicrobiia bacterium]
MNHPAHDERAASPIPLVTVVAVIGIVFGDIGTSPLYALRESFLGHEGLDVTEANVLGILSLIFWSLVIVVSIKYLTLVMRADNDGEGGILALTALIVPARNRVSSRRRLWLILVGLFGTSLLYGDGMITPAISVLSAVEGMEIAAPGLEPYVIPISVVILIGLFLIQRRGTGRIGSVFGPVMVVWFVVIALLGLVHVVQHPNVLAALNPGYAVSFFIRNAGIGFLALGSVFLVVTGGEALYADMGHFGRRPIQRGWFALVLPALLLNYFGQGALLVTNPAAIDNPFYRLAPSWALYPMVVLATLATVIASQALISGAFSLTKQAVQLGYLPRVRIEHTSAEEIGQIYVPAVNYALMVACVGLVFGFRSSGNLAAAYGVAVTATMAITTVLFFVVIRDRWRWRLPVSLAVTAVLLVVDLAFLGANLFKIPAGGWFPLVAGLLVFTGLTTWKTGRRLVANRLRRGQLPIERFVANIAKNPPHRVAGTAVYMFPEPGPTPPALLANFRQSEVLHERIVLLSVLIADVPRVPAGRRATVHDLGDNFFQVVLKFGFQDDPKVPQALGNIVSPVFGFDPGDAKFFLARERVIPSRQPGMALWRERLYALMHRNATSAAQYFELPAQDVMELGIQVEI